MNHHDMDVVAPPSLDLEKEEQLAVRLQEHLDFLIRDGFFDDCEPRGEYRCGPSEVSAGKLERTLTFVMFFSGRRAGAGPGGGRERGQPIALDQLREPGRTLALDDPRKRGLPLLARVALVCFRFGAKSGKLARHAEQPLQALCAPHLAKGRRQSSPLALRQVKSALVLLERGRARGRARRRATLGEALLCGLS